jgi:hypothetical protein
MLRESQEDQAPERLVMKKIGRTPAPTRRQPDPKWLNSRANVNMISGALLAVAVILLLYGLHIIH